MKLTIITPTLNASATIARLLDSVASQSVTCEHLIVDGGSTDNTKSIVENYPHAMWADAPGSTIYEAQNIGIGLAQGEWLYFIGADDALFDESVVAKILSYTGGALVQQGRIEYPGWPTHWPNVRQQAFVLKKELYDMYGLYDPKNLVYADVAYRKMLANAGVRTDDTRVCFARVAANGFSSRGTA